MFDPLTAKQILSTVRPAQEWEGLVRANRVSSATLRRCLAVERSEKEDDAVGSLFSALGRCLDTSLCVDNIEWLWPHLLDWDDENTVMVALCDMPTFDVVADMCNGNWPKHACLEYPFDTSEAHAQRVVVDALSTPMGQGLARTKWNSEVFSCWDERRWKAFAKEVVWWVGGQIPTLTSTQLGNIHSALRPICPCLDTVWAEILTTLKSTEHHHLADALVLLPDFAATKQVLVDNCAEVAEVLMQQRAMSTACPSLLECLVWLEGLSSSVELPRTVVRDAAMDLLVHASVVRSRPLAAVLLSRCTKEWNNMLTSEQVQWVLHCDRPTRLLDFLSTTDCRLEGVWDARNWDLDEAHCPSASAAQQNHRLRGQLREVVGHTGERSEQKRGRKI